MTPTPSTQTIGQRIQDARKAAGLTPTGLAAAIGVHLDTIQRYERGTKRGPSYQDVVAIAHATGKPVGFFMETETEAVA